MQKNKRGDLHSQTHCADTNTNTLQACTKRKFHLTRADLPLSCPHRDERVWDAHPRVYLPIEETGRFTCPYCGAEYVLTDF